MRLIDNVELAAAIPERLVLRPDQQFAHGVDAAVARGVNFNHAVMRTLQPGSNNTSKRSFAATTRAGEQKRFSDSSTLKHNLQ